MWGSNYMQNWQLLQRLASVTTTDVNHLDDSVRRTDPSDEYIRTYQQFICERQPLGIFDTYHCRKRKTLKL
jgi:hypothetical protein